MTHTRCVCAPSDTPGDRISDSAAILSRYAARLSKVLRQLTFCGHLWATATAAAENGTSNRSFDNYKRLFRPFIARFDNYKWLFGPFIPRLSWAKKDNDKVSLSIGTIASSSTRFFFVKKAQTSFMVREQRIILYTIFIKKKKTHLYHQAVCVQTHKAYIFFTIQGPV